MSEKRAMNMDEFINIVDLPYWVAIEKKFEGQKTSN